MMFKNRYLFIIALLIILLATSFGSSYTRSTTALEGLGADPSLFSYIFNSADYADSCQEGLGQDFVLQIAPFGCTPAVVRSDLLESRDVPVFCQLAATKVNPLIDVDVIENIRFSGNYPKEVRGVGFHPAEAALGNIDTRINSPILNNIGYAVIVLKQQKNESSMPEFVEGEFVANLKYDVRNAFGVGKAGFYLPILENQEWEKKKEQYSFWSGKGYVRADNIYNDKATISLYSGDRKVTSFDLREKESSNMVYLPGFDCLAGLKVKLDALENPDTRAKLYINGEIFEVADGEDFLEGKCKIEDLEKKGIFQTVKIRCKTDNGYETFSLKITPKVELDICDEGGCKNNTYSLGDKLYTSKDGKAVYLGYAGTTGNDVNKESLFIYTFAMPVHKDKLDANELAAIAKVAQGYQYEKQSGNQLTDTIFNLFKGYVSVFINTYEYLADSKSYTRIFYVDNGHMVEDKNIKVLGFSSAQDIDLQGDILDNYEKAKRDYEAVIENYASTKYPSIETKTKGEQALFEYIKLTEGVGQKLTLLELCNEFKEKYPDSKLEISEYCANEMRLANSEISTKHVLIDRELKAIFFRGIYEPTYEEYSAEVKVKGPNGAEKIFLIRKNQIVYLDAFRGDGTEHTGEYMQLINLEENMAEMDVPIIKERSTTGEIVNYIFGTTRERLEKNVPKGVAGGYVLTLTDVNLKKVAKVSINPNINDAGTKANVSFKIGIEKRAIQLSPDQINEKLQQINEEIAKWEEKYEKLGKIVKTMKTACLGTGLILTLKNFVANTGGKSIARQEIMRGKNGWYEICERKVIQDEATYPSIDQCLMKHSDDIDDDVDKWYEDQKKLDERLKQLRKPCETSTFFGGTVVNNTCLGTKILTDDYRNRLKANFKTKHGGNVMNFSGEEVDIDTFVDNLNPSTTSVEDLRDLEVYSGLEGSDTLNAMVKERLIAKTSEIHSLTSDDIARQGLSDKFGINNAFWFSSGKDMIPVPVLEDTLWKNVKDKFTGTLPNIDDNTFVQIGGDKYLGGQEYLFVLNNDYVVTETYNISASKVLTKHTDGGNPFGLDFNKFDASKYENKYISSAGEKYPVARYFETEPYKGYPALVPFDLDKGWYVSTQQTFSSLSGIRAYDESGRAHSFEICNVGANGREERGDTCASFVNGQDYSQFPGLSSDQARNLVAEAYSALEQARQQYRSGASKIQINTRGKKYEIRVGSPAVEIPDIQCQDFMSPKDCRLMFNICDPVICPSSRCDLGGAYPVSDVVQSGIFGSIALCLPNFPEVYIPVCLSGIHAGMDGWIQVMDDYRNCLNTSLKTGETVGICDELYSVYGCEFLWRQGLPLARLAVPKVLEAFAGENVRGGGEYLGVQSAWDNAEDSIGYFTQYYGENSYNAFKYRSVEEVGTPICKSFVSGTFPAGGSLLDGLTEPDSPSQFHGWFDEIPHTTATNPPFSQYKVFFHVYAGRDRGVNYRVYLRESPGTSFYQDTSSPRQIASGYLAAGDKVSDTVEILAPSGYQELCIMVNEQLECDFKQVSTDFAVNYISDQYAAEQASRTDITSRSECISGSSSLYAFARPNIQEGATDFISPELYGQGITRICSTDCPSKNEEDCGKENSRWVEVGYCDEKYMKCWLDKESVENVIKNTDIEDAALEEHNARVQRLLNQSGNYLSTEVQLDKELKKKPSDDPKQAINFLTGLFERVFLDYHTGHLHYLRGNEYAMLAIDAFKELIENKRTQTPTSTSLSQVGATTKLKVGEIFNFTINGIDHQIKVTSISGGKVSFVVLSEPLTFSLESGESVTVAPDGEEKDKINIRVDELNEEEQYVVLELKLVAFDKSAEKRTEEAIEKIEEDLEGIVDLSGYTPEEKEQFYEEFLIDYPIFEVGGIGDGFLGTGFFEGEIHYEYSFGSWAWRISDNCGFLPVSDGTIFPSTGTFGHAECAGNQAPTSHHDLIGRLTIEDYAGGVKLIVDKVKEDKLNIHTESVDFQKASYFWEFVTDLEGVKMNLGMYYPVHLRYIKEWEFNFGGDDWKKISENQDFISGLAYSSFLENLATKNFDDGARYIFNLKFMELAEEQIDLEREGKEPFEYREGYDYILIESSFDAKAYFNFDKYEGWLFDVEGDVFNWRSVSAFEFNSLLYDDEISEILYRLSLDPLDYDKGFRALVSFAYADEIAGKSVCEDCGKGWFDFDVCTKEECWAIGKVRGFDCAFWQYWGNHCSGTEISYDRETNFKMDIGHNGDYDKNQLTHADPDLITLLNCIDDKHVKNGQGHITITSITDNNIYVTPRKCDLRNEEEIYIDLDNCVHRKGSCHYFEIGGKLRSRAADLRTVGYEVDLLRKFAGECSVELGMQVCTLLEYTPNHLHVSIKSCENCNGVEYGEDFGTNGVIENIPVPIEPDGSYVDISAQGLLDEEDFENFDFNVLETGKYALLKDSITEVVFCKFQETGKQLNGELLAINKNLVECRELRKSFLRLEKSFESSGTILDYDCEDAESFFGADVEECHKNLGYEDGKLSLCYVDYTRLDDCEPCKFNAGCAETYEDNQLECDLDPCVLGCEWDSLSGTCVFSESTEMVCQKEVLMEDSYAFEDFILENEGDLNDFCFGGRLIVEDKRIVGIDVSGQNFVDLSSLSKLDALTYLDLEYNEINDVSALSTLSNLKTLKLNNNWISDVSALENLNLDYFGIKDNCLVKDYDYSGFDDLITFEKSDKPKLGCVCEDCGGGTGICSEDECEEIETRTGNSCYYFNSVCMSE